MKSAVQQHPIVVKSLAGFGCAAILVGANSIVLSAKPFGHIKEAKLWKYPKLFAAFAYHGSPLYCLASAALVLALALHSGPLATLAARLLSSKPIRHLEMVSLSLHSFLISFNWASVLLTISRPGYGPLICIFSVI